MNLTDFLHLSISAVLLVLLAGVAALSVMNLYRLRRRAPRPTALHKRLGELVLGTFVGPVAGMWDHMRPVERRLYLYGALIEGPLGAVTGRRLMIWLLGGRPLRRVREPLRGRRRRGQRRSQGRSPRGIAGRRTNVCLPVGIRIGAAGSAIELTIEMACVHKTRAGSRSCSTTTPSTAYTVRRFRNEGTSESTIHPDPLGALFDYYAGYRPPTRRDPHPGSAGSS